MNIQSQFSNQLAAVVVAVLAAKSGNAALAEAAKAGKDSLASALRQYATDTHAAGAPVADAAIALRAIMGAQVDADEKPLIPSGTVKNYTAAFKGYRVTLERNEPIAAMNTAAATLVVASDEVKNITAAKKLFAAVTKKWTAAQWNELVAAYSDNAVTVTAGDEIAADDVADVAEAAAA